MDKILSIPLSNEFMQDFLIWQEAKDGVFSIKTTYHLAQILEDLARNLDAVGSSCNLDGRWTKYRRPLPNPRSNTLSGEHAATLFL